MIEKRRFVRVDIPIRIRYQIEGKKNSRAEGISKNIGGMGICVHLTHRLPTGSLLKLTLALPGATEPIETEARLVWIDKAESVLGDFRGDFEAGLRFTSISRVGRAAIVNFICESVKRRKESRISSQEPSS